MSKDDLVLETTRLFGYQRRGKRIENRIEDGLQLLNDMGTICEIPGEKIDFQGEIDLDTKLLQRVYTPADNNSEKGVGK